MTISEIVREGFHYARTCKSLWVFGFFVGIASGGSGGGGGGGRGGGGGLSLSAVEMVPILIVACVVVLAITMMRFISEGALIEGVMRARHGGAMTTGEAFRAGLAHWGVLLRIALIYFAVTIGSLILLAAPAIVALRALGAAGAIALGIPAFLVGLPWLVTIYLVQAFAARIAVLENRNALDAIAKARLFLHGRLMHGLTLMAASLAGTLLMTVAAIVAMLPVVLMLIALVPILRVAPVVVIGCVLLLPAIFVLTAILGTFRSSVWTIGYATQVES